MTSAHLRHTTQPDCCREAPVAVRFLRVSKYPRVLGSAADIGAFEGSSDVIFADGFD